MNKDNKELVLNLTNKLINTSENFIIEKLKYTDSIDTSLLIDIILSAHFSSCFTMMTHLANISDGKEIIKKVNKFIRKMEDILPTINPIKKVTKE